MRWFALEMWFLHVLLLAMASLGLAQMAPMGGCVSTTTNPPCTLTFHPFMAPQIRPTSTVYNTIVTEHMNVSCPGVALARYLLCQIIDCRYCTIEQVDDNPPARGPFTARVTQNILNITRVGCMEATTAITRRDIRGYGSVDEPQPTATGDTIAAKSLLTSSGSELVARNALSVSEPADLITANLDPGNPDLRQQAIVYTRQVRTAQLAIDFIYSGFELTSLCEQSRTAVVRQQWTEQDYDAIRASNIICFASSVGLFFDVSYPQLKAQFSTTLTALQSLSGPDANLTEVCQAVSLDFAKPLEIDSTGIKAYICSNGETTSSSAIPPPPMVTAFSGSTASVGIVTSFATGDLGPWANSTVWSWSAGGTATSFISPIATGTAFSSGTGGSGTWGNGTGWNSTGGSGVAGATGFRTGTGTGNWSWTTSWEAGPSGSWSGASGSNATGNFGTGSQAGSWASGGSWIVATATGDSWNVSGAASGTGAGGGSGSIWVSGDSWVQATATGDSWNASVQGGSGTGTATGEWGGGSWTSTAAGESWNASGQDASGSGGWGTGGSWIATGSAWSTGGVAGTGGATGWVVNGSSVLQTGSGPMPTGWGTGGAWTATGGATVGVTVWGANATATGASVTGWQTGSWTAGGWNISGTAGASWTGTGWSWDNSNSTQAANATTFFSPGAITTIAVTGVSGQVFSIVIPNITAFPENATRWPVNPTAPLGYYPPSTWTTSTINGSIPKQP